MDSFFRHAGELAPEITDYHFVELFQILCSIVKSIVVRGAPSPQKPATAAPP